MGAWRNFQAGRCWIGRLHGNEDLIQAVTTLGLRERIATAAVTITGRISRVTLGVFDPRQQVYVTRTEVRPMEIVSCRGLLSTAGASPFLQAHIQLADEDTVIGGRLFSETLADEAECVVEERLGPLTDRVYDEESGQLVLTFRDAGT